jgi:hypothetical protein
VRGNIKAVDRLIHQLHPGVVSPPSPLPQCPFAILPALREQTSRDLKLHFDHRLIHLAQLLEKPCIHPSLPLSLSIKILIGS